MTVTTEQLADMKNYLRIDFTEDDSEIGELIETADIYIKNAVGYVDVKNKLYKRAVKLLVSEWYENRTPTTVGHVSRTLQFSLESIFNQLRYCYQEPEV